MGCAHPFLFVFNVIVPTHLLVQCLRQPIAGLIYHLIRDILTYLFHEKIRELCIGGIVVVF